MERTGRDQRRPGVVHAEDVRDYLLRHPGIGEELVAVKTSQKDELKEVDEVGGLLSRERPIRFIITKQALQEGWDCSFAYVLTILTNPGSKSALTQLVGRILRQPGRRFEVVVAGHRVALFGTVSMDMVTVDLTDVPEDAVEVGARVEIFGPNAPVERVAQQAGTIPYEILTGIGPRVARVFM